MFFDVLNDELSALFVRDVRAVGGVVHGVGEVADEDTRDAPAGHALDGECPIEDAHVGVDAHDDEALGAAGAQGGIDLFAAVGDVVGGHDGKAGVLASPGLVGGVTGRVAPAAGVVDGQGRIGKRFQWRGLDAREIKDGAALGRILVELHGVGGRMDDEDAVGTQGDEGVVHAGNHGIDALGGAPAPVTVPHIADDNGGAGWIERGGGLRDGPLAGVRWGLHARAQRQPEGRGGLCGERGDED